MYVCILYILYQWPKETKNIARHADFLQPYFDLRNWKGFLGEYANDIKFFGARDRLHKVVFKVIQHHVKTELLQFGFNCTLSNFFPPFKHPKFINLKANEFFETLNESYDTIVSLSLLPNNI